jgi:hypothetical protein
MLVLKENSHPLILSDKGTKTPLRGEKLSSPRRGILIIAKKSSSLRGGKNSSLYPTKVVNIRI